MHLPHCLAACLQGVRGLKVTHTLPLFAAANSQGLAAMLRLHSTPADHLGWLPDLISMPSDLSLDGQRVGQLYNIMPTNKPATRSAQVVAGVVGGVEVYCKTSSSIESEVTHSIECTGPATAHIAAITVCSVCCMTFEWCDQRMRSLQVLAIAHLRNLACAHTPLKS